MANPPVLKLKMTAGSSTGDGSGSTTSSQFVSVFPSSALLAQLADMGFELKHASKALVETQNKSLAAALDYLETHPYDPIDEIKEHSAQETMQVVTPAELQPKAQPPPPAAAPATAAPLKTRYDLSGRDSFEERQRVKEAERMKREKAEQEAAKLRAKKEAEAERLERMRRAGVDPMQVADSTSDEAKKRFEEKTRAREEEEKKRARAEEMKKREETRKLLEEEKQKRLEKFPELAQPKVDTKPKQTDEEKRKQEWLKEKQWEAAEKERLRRDVEEDKKRRAEKAKSAEELAAEAKKQAETTRQLAELRRLRFGGVPAPTNPDSMDTTPMEPAAEVPVEAPAPAQTPPAQPSYQELQRQRYAEHLKKKEAEEMRAKREEALARIQSNAAAAVAAIPSPQPTPSPPPAVTTATAPLGSDSPVECTIQVRLPDGHVLKQVFTSTDNIKAVHEFVENWLPLGAMFNLIMPFPHKEFDDASMHLTLKEAGLVPRAMLTVLTLGNRGVVTAAVADVEEEDIDTDEMTYEQLMSLESKIGNVPVGFEEEQLARLPKEDYDPLQHKEFRCAICQEDFVKGHPVTKLNCNHVFHRLHICQWLKDHKDCPVCHSEVTIAGTASQPKPQPNYFD